MNESTASMGMMILWMVVIFGVMYFLMIRPEKKKQEFIRSVLRRKSRRDFRQCSTGWKSVTVFLQQAASME